MRKKNKVSQPFLLLTHPRKRRTHLFFPFPVSLCFLSDKNSSISGPLRTIWTFFSDTLCLFITLCLYDSLVLMTMSASLQDSFSHRNKTLYIKSFLFWDPFK